MTWQDDLRAEVPRSEIPAFLVDLQALVAALREGRPWHALVTQPLRDHPSLVQDYLSPGAARDAVADRLRR